MRLNREQIFSIAADIADVLVREEFIIVDDPQAFKEKIINIITEELKIEDQLNEDVKEILSQHGDKLMRHEVDYFEMFKMVKAKLAKERNIVL
jgi:hypothetical protein